MRIHFLSKGWFVDVELKLSHFNFLNKSALKQKYKLFTFTTNNRIYLCLREITNDIWQNIIFRVANLVHKLNMRNKCSTVNKQQ